MVTKNRFEIQQKPTINEKGEPIDSAVENDKQWQKKANPQYYKQMDKFMLNEMKKLENKKK